MRSRGAVPRTRTLQCRPSGVNKIVFIISESELFVNPLGNLASVVFVVFRKSDSVRSRTSIIRRKTILPKRSKQGTRSMSGLAIAATL